MPPESPRPARILIFCYFACARLIFEVFWNFFKLERDFFECQFLETYSDIFENPAQCTQGEASESDFRLKNFFSPKVGQNNFFLTF